MTNAQIHEAASRHYDTPKRVGWYVRWHYDTTKVAGHRTGANRWEADVTGTMPKREALKLAKAIAASDGFAWVTINKVIDPNGRWQDAEHAVLVSAGQNFDFVYESTDEPSATQLKNKRRWALMQELVHKGKSTRNHYRPYVSRSRWYLARMNNTPALGLIKTSRFTDAATACPVNDPADILRSLRVQYLPVGVIIEDAPQVDQWLPARFAARFSPANHDFVWSPDGRHFRPVKLRWWDDASYARYQGDCGIDEPWEDSAAAHAETRAIEGWTSVDTGATDTDCMLKHGGNGDPEPAGG